MENKLTISLIEYNDQLKRMIDHQHIILQELVIILSRYMSQEEIEKLLKEGGNER